MISIIEYFPCHKISSAPAFSCFHSVKRLITKSKVNLILFIRVKVVAYETDFFKFNSSINWFTSIAYFFIKLSSKNSFHFPDKALNKRRTNIFYRQFLSPAITLLSLITRSRVQVNSLNLRLRRHHGHVNHGKVVTCSGRLGICHDVIAKYGNFIARYDCIVCFGWRGAVGRCAGGSGGCAVFWCRGLKFFDGDALDYCLTDSHI